MGKGNIQPAAPIIDLLRIDDVDHIEPSVHGTFANPFLEV